MRQVRGMPRPPLPPTELLAEPYVLRAIVSDDWPLEQALSRVPDVVRWTVYPPDLSDDDAQDRIARIEQAGRDGRLRRYRITAGPEVLGTAGISITGDPEVFYALLPSGRGRGAATIAARALSDWALDHGAPRVQLLTIPGNTASEAVARRAGFTIEGREIRSQRGTDIEMLRWIKGPRSA